jgi:bifunctional ADP-heptose synthase (sugar kinase/adenylyltransferase)
MPPTRTPAIHGWEDVSERPIVILGDAMLDRFLYGSAERLSPEAPVPVVRLAERRAMAGGAGNVARNVAALGGVPRLVALAGDDADGAELAALLGEGARLLRMGCLARWRRRCPAPAPWCCPTTARAY